MFVFFCLLRSTKENASLFRGCPVNASESSEGFLGLSIGQAVMTSHSRCAKGSASCDTKFFLLREHRLLVDVFLKNFVAAAVFSVSYFLNVVEEFRSCLSKPEGSVLITKYIRKENLFQRLRKSWIARLTLGREQN